MRDIPRCKFCGDQIEFSMNSKGKFIPIHLSDPKKKCVPKVKIYTKEEIRRLNEERAKSS